MIENGKEKEMKIRETRKENFRKWCLEKCGAERGEIPVRLTLTLKYSLYNENLAELLWRIHNFLIRIKISYQHGSKIGLNYSYSFL